MEFDNVQAWSRENRMPLNIKTRMKWFVCGNKSVTLPDPIPSLERKIWLRISGVTLQDNPCNGDLYFEEIFKKASARMYIMRVCKYYGLSLEQLDLLFDSLIMYIFTFAIELWGCAYESKYLNQIDTFIKLAHS
mgnify:CR=1 FL=1